MGPGLAAYDKGGADIVLLDLMMPGVPGTEVCRQLRQRGPVPVIMVTARDSEIDKVVGLELGANDYVTKPFSQRELVARIRAVLRRGQDVELLPDVVRRTASGWTSSVTRSPSTAATVTTRAEGVRAARDAAPQRRPGDDPRQLIDRIWARTTWVTQDLDVHVKRLRTKIESDRASRRCC